MKKLVYLNALIIVVILLAGLLLVRWMNHDSLP
jgi:hypothetical protein